MNPSNDIRICISPSQGKIIIKEQDGPVTTRKEVDQQSLISCFKNSLRTDDPGFSSRFLPLNCLSVWQGNEYVLQRGQAFCAVASQALH